MIKLTIIATMCHHHQKYRLTLCIIILVFVKYIGVHTTQEESKETGLVNRIARELLVKATKVYIKLMLVLKRLCTPKTLISTILL